MNRAILAVLFLPLFAMSYADAQVDEDVSVDPDNEPWPKLYVIPEGDYRFGLHAYIQANGTMIAINGFTPESHSSINVNVEDPNGAGILASQSPVSSDGVFSEEVFLTEIVDGAYHISITHPEMDSGHYIDVYVGASGGLLSEENTYASTLVLERVIPEPVVFESELGQWYKPYAIPDGDYHYGMHIRVQTNGTMVIVDGFTPEPEHEEISIRLHGPNGWVSIPYAKVNSEGIFKSELLLEENQIIDGVYELKVRQNYIGYSRIMEIYLNTFEGYLVEQDTSASTLSFEPPMLHELMVGFERVSNTELRIHGNTTITNNQLSIRGLPSIEEIDDVRTDSDGKFSITAHLVCPTIDRDYGISVDKYIDGFEYHRYTTIRIDACEYNDLDEIEAWYKPYTIPEGDHHYGMHSRVQANDNMIVIEGFTPESEHEYVVINVHVPNRDQIVYRIYVDSDGMFKKKIWLTEDDVVDGSYRISIRQLDIDPSRFMTMYIQGSDGNLSGDYSASTLTLEPPLRHELSAKFERLNDTAVHVSLNTTVTDESLIFSVSGNNDYYEYIRADQNGEFSTTVLFTCSAEHRDHKIVIYKRIAEFYYDERAYFTVNACENKNPITEFEPEIWPKPYTIPDGDHSHGTDVRTQTEANGTLIRIDGFTHEPKLGTITVGVLGPDKTFVASTPISINAEGIFRKNIRLDADVIENGTYRIDLVQGSQPVRLLQTAVYSTGENLTAEDNTVTTLSSTPPATHRLEAGVEKITNTDIYIEGTTTMTDRAVRLFVTLDGAYVHIDMLRPAEDGEFSTSLFLECSDDKNRAYTVWLEQRVEEFTYRDYRTTTVRSCEDVTSPEPVVELIEYENDGALRFPIADTVRVEPLPSTLDELPDDVGSPGVVSKVVGDVIDVAGGTNSFVVPLSSGPYMVTADGNIETMIIKSVGDIVNISEDTVKNVVENAVEDIPVEELEDTSTGKSTVEESASDTVPSTISESTPASEPEKAPEPESNLTAPTTEPPEVTAPVDLAPINISTPELPPAPPLPEAPVVRPNVTAPPVVAPVNMTTPELPPAPGPNMTAPVDVVTVNMTEPELPTLPEAPVVEPNVTAPPDVPPVNMTTPELPPASEPNVTAPADVVPVNMTEPELLPAPSLPEPIVPVNETRPETTPQPVPEVNHTIPEVEPRVSDEEPAEPETPEPPVPETIVPVEPEPIDPEPELPAEPVASEEPAKETTPSVSETESVEETAPAPPEPETVETTTPAPPEETVEEPAGPTQVNLEPETVPEPPKAPAPPPAPPAQEPVLEPESEVQEPESIKEAMPEIEP